MKNTKNTSITPPSAIHNPRSAIRNLLARHLPAPFARARSVVVALAGLVVLLATHQSATAAGVAVGSSTLIGTPQYSDTWTTTVNGGIAGRAVDTLPTGTGLNVENNYGNTARAWSSAPGSMRTDATAAAASTSYPGTSGAGSATGIVQTATDWGFDYGLSSNFVIQTDATQATDRVNMTFGPNIGIFGTNNISIFFRNSDAGVKIGIFSPGLGEIPTGFNTFIPTNYTWNNYAIKVDTTAKTIEVFTNEVSRGILDLNTFSGGSFASRMSNAKVGIGMNSTIGWTDNFQVGIPGSSLTACDMLTLNWGASVGSISGTAVTLAVPYGTDVTTLDPTYTVSPLATGAPVSGTARNFTSPQTYTVTAQDGISQKVYTVTVAFNPVIILTGGDAGEGFAPLNNTYAAVSLSQNGVGSVQGVAFNTNASAVTMTGNPGAAGGGANFTQVTTDDETDDENLAKVFTHGYYDGSSITATVTGLTAGLVYQLDSFIGVMGSSGRTEYVQVFDGLTPLTANQQVDLLGASPTLSPAYDIRQTFTAPAGGTVQVKYTGSFFPLLCGVAITYADTTPSAPAITGITAGNGTLSVAFTAPVSDGGSAITNYKYSTDNGTSWTSAGQTTSPILISGLTNGTPYQVKILAVNSIGDGTPSDAVSGTPAPSTACDMVSFTAAGVSGTITPGAPNTVSVTLPPGTDVSALTPTVVVSQWATYAPTGPQDFTNSVTTPVPYTVTADDGTTKQVYQVTLVVPNPPPNDNFVNAIALPGTSGSQTGTGNRYATRETGEPAIFGATHTVWFKWTAPSDGSYTIDTLGSTKLGGGEWDAMLGIYTGSPVNALTALTGLPDGNPQDNDEEEEESVTFDVTAGTTYHIQAAGYSDQEASNINLTYTFMSSSTAPTAPSITGITPGNGTLSVAFTAPVSDGGSAITNYKYSTDNGGTFTAVSPASTTSPILISGLTNGTTYQVKILAVNSVGDGAASAAVSGTPAASGTSYGTWETTNGASGGANADSNHNGVSNGIEFFMGGTAASPATLPALVNTAGTWSWTIPYDPAALATYKFRVSDDLSGWTDIVPPDASITVLPSPDRIQFTLPAGTGKKFCQLVVITP